MGPEPDSGLLGLPGVRVIACEETASTNADALALARAGERGPLWITARRQTAGRGRRSRPWHSASGNLHASLLLSDPAPARDAGGLSLVAALAVHDAIVGLCPPLRPRAALKWPNDVLLSGAKVAGILIEAESAAGGPVAVVVGVGVNCAAHPEHMEFPATSLAGAGAGIAPEELFRALGVAMACRLAQWDRGANFAAIRADWIARAIGMGNHVHVRLPDRDLSGTFEDLDQAGRLVLRLADGAVQTIAAGEVFGLAKAAALRIDA